MDNEMLMELIRRYEQAYFVVEKRLHVLFKEIMPEELTVDQFVTLRFIRNRGRVTSSELAENFFVGRSSITAIINRMVDKRLIERHPDQSDRRVIYLSLTESGENLAAQLEIKMRDLLAKYLQQFQADEASSFIHTYEKLAKVLMQEPGRVGEE